MLETNKENCVMMAVGGKVHNPVLKMPYKVDESGKAFCLPGTGGICYNVKIGDSVFKFAGDHIEPCVSVQNADEKENDALNFLACIGNTAVIVSGDAKGQRGAVTGKHGVTEHVIVHFDESALQTLAPNDEITVKSWGQGLKLLNYPQIAVKNCDPLLFEKLGITERNGKLIVPVKAAVPSYLMGSGIGIKTSFSGDYDIMTADKDRLEELCLLDLRLGDVVYLKDCDSTFGRGYREGAATVGVVVHCDSFTAGHGPGVTTIMSCKTPLLEYFIDGAANIGNYLNLF